MPVSNETRPRLAVGVTRPPSSFAQALGTKCREAAGALLDEMLGGVPINATAKTSAAMILTCLIYDSYHSDVWDYDEG
jgi:hypothetical protein